MMVGEGLKAHPGTTITLLHGAAPPSLGLGPYRGGKATPMKNRRLEMVTVERDPEKFSYVVHDKESGMYFCGVVELSVGIGFVLSPIIFNAVTCAGLKEVERVMKELPDQMEWASSTVGEVNVSPNLRAVK